MIARPDPVFWGTLSGRMLLFGMLPAGIIFAGTMAYSLVMVFSELRKDNEHLLQILADEVASEVEMSNARAVAAAKVMAFAQESGMFGRREASLDLARRVLAEFPEFTGAYVGYEPNADRDDRGFLVTADALTRRGLDAQGRFIPYWYRDQADNDKLLLDPLLDMDASMYYQGVKERFLQEGQTRYMITEPYVYEGKMIVEYPYPIVKDGEFKGIAGVDRALTDIAGFLDRIKRRDGVDAFLISRQGRFVAATTSAHSGPAEEGQLETRTIADTPYRDLFGRLFRDGQRPSFVLEKDPIEGGHYYFASAPVPTGEWMVVLREAEDDITGPIWARLWVLFPLVGLALGAVTLLLLRAARSTSRRIGYAVQAAERLSQGDASSELVDAGGVHDEVWSMTESFNRLTRSYRRITEVCQTIAQGDFSQRAEVRGEHDVLALAINEMAERREQAEQALHAARARLDHLLTSAPAVLYSFKASGDYAPTFISNNVSELLGYEPRDYLESPDFWQRGLHPEDHDLVMEALPRLFKQGRLTLEYRYRRRDGGYCWLQDELRLLTDEHGEPQEVVGSWSDISERKKADEQVLRAKEMAEAATRTKSEFLANMSHEIRTPMNGIIGFTTLALKTELSDQQRDYLGKIRSSANALLNLINDILDFSKIEAGKLDIETTGFQLQDVLEELGDLFADQASKKDIELIIHRDPKVPSALLGDPLRLRQVLVNLTSNAMKFTQRGEIYVHAGVAGRDDQDRLRLRFEVRDTGIGIPKEHRDKLFASFTQADGSTTRKYGGTGLGLAICRQLVELMGGRIGVQSAPGAGSTFWFELPFKRQAEHQEPAYPTAVDLRGLKVLVVDDNATSREVLSEMLRSFGFHVQAQPSGEAALEALHAQAGSDRPYQLVMMDWKLGGMDGLEASRQIRQNPALAQIPIVMVTAFGREHERQVGEQLGINGFLGKPIQQSVLFDTLMAVFGQKGTGARPMVTEESLQGQGLKGARVLLAEDNLINQEVAVNILAEVGVQVDVANNGLEALEALRRQAYDSVLMDMQMPEMDGYEAMGVIRQDRRWEGMPIIAMTAHAMQGDRERCLTAGADDYVSKPIDPDRLFATLKRWIRVEEGRAGQVPEPRPRAPAQTDAGVGHPLERLSGFHVPEALGRLRGNEALYCKLLKGFAQDNQDTVERIGAALDSRDLKAAHALVHTLKGVAGNLSALELLQATRALEVDIKAWMAAPQARPETLDERLARVGSRLAQALAAIADAGLMEAPEAGAAGGAAQDRSLTPSTAADLARRIREAVEIGDIMSLDGIAAELPKGSPYGGEITRLAGDFDLDGLERLAQELQERAKGTEI